MATEAIVLARNELERQKALLPALKNASDNIKGRFWCVEYAYRRVQLYVYEYEYLLRTAYRTPGTVVLVPGRVEQGPDRREGEVRPHCAVGHAHLPRGGRAM